MGRTRFGVADRLDLEELAARHRAARDPVERDRWRMIRLLVAGRSLAEVAEVTGSSTRWVREVVRRHNEQGPDGLADLDRALAERCLALGDQPELIKAATRFHRWPEAA